MKAILLARVSTEMQEDGFSLDAQLERNLHLLKVLLREKELNFMKQYNL